MTGPPPARSLRSAPGPRLWALLALGLPASILAAPDPQAGEAPVAAVGAAERPVVELGAPEAIAAEPGAAEPGAAEPGAAEPGTRPMARTAIHPGWVTGPRRAPPSTAEVPAVWAGDPEAGAAPPGWRHAAGDARPLSPGAWWGAFMAKARPVDGQLRVDCAAACRVFVDGELAHEQAWGTGHPALIAVADTGPALALEVWRAGGGDLHPTELVSHFFFDDFSVDAVDCAHTLQALLEMGAPLNRCGEAAFRSGDFAAAVQRWQASLAHDPLQVVLRDRVRGVQPDAAPAPPLTEVPPADADAATVAPNGPPVTVADHRWREVTLEGRAVTWAAQRFTAQVAVPVWTTSPPAGAEVLEAWRTRGTVQVPVLVDARGVLRVTDLAVGEAIGLRWRQVDQTPRDGGALGADDPHATTHFEATLCLPAGAPAVVDWRYGVATAGLLRTVGQPEPGALGAPVGCVRVSADRLPAAPADPNAADRWVDRPALVYALHANAASFAVEADRAPQPAPEDWAWAAARPQQGVAARVAAATARAAEVNADVHRLRGLLALIGVRSALARARPRTAIPWQAAPPSAAMLPVSLVYVPEMEAFFMAGGAPPSGELSGVRAWVLGASPQVETVKVAERITEDAADLRALGTAVAVNVQGPEARARVGRLTGLFWLDRATDHRAGYRRSAPAGAPIPLPESLRVAPEPAGRTAWLGAPRVHHTRWTADAAQQTLIWPLPSMGWRRAGAQLEVHQARTAIGAVGVRTVRLPGGLATAPPAELSAWLAAVDALDRAPILEAVPEVSASDRGEVEAPGAEAAWPPRLPFVASTPDASTPDVSPPDASTPDASTPDASTPDASMPDASATPPAAEAADAH